MADTSERTVVVESDAFFAFLASGVVELMAIRLTAEHRRHQSRRFKLA
jgi:hypothetical protein